MITKPLRLGVLFLVPLSIAGALKSDPPTVKREQTRAGSKKTDVKPAEKKTMKVEYLEIVTRSVDELCDALGKANGVTFGKPIEELGNARTARLKDGGRIGVRAPMNKTEVPVTRPYFLVEDIKAAVKVAEAAGAEVMMAPTKAHGCTFAIYFLGGIEYGLWQAD